VTTDTQTFADRLKEVEAELAFFMELGRELTATLDDRKVLEIIAKGAHTYVGPTHTTLFLTGADRRTYEVALACGYDPGSRRAPIPVLEGLSGRVLRTGQQVRLDAAALAQAHPAPPDLVMPGPLAEVMCLPILHRRKALAALVLSHSAEAGPFTADQIERLTRLLEQSRMAVDRALLYRRTADLAITDDLTQLFNHRYIHQSLELKVAQGGKEPHLSLIFMDLDSFKAINDTHGHLAGSHALTEVAHVLTDNLRTEDIIARYGGDEFVIILPDTNLEVAMQIAERLAKSLAVTTFLPQLGGMRLTASFGVAAYPEHAASPRKLVQHADQAMYAAKALGGNRAVSYQP
jgi:diguanylate cyclase (GGDEF)-like protein